MTCIIGNKKHGSYRFYAFTLIELLIVVVIVSSLLALTVPRFNNTLRRFTFDQFCQTLTDRMRLLKERASAERTTYRLRFEIPTELIAVEVYNETDNQFVATQGRFSKALTIPSGITLQCDSDAIIFYPDATIEGKNIVVKDAQSQATIAISQSIGRVSMVTNEQPTTP